MQRILLTHPGSNLGLTVVFLFLAVILARAKRKDDVVIMANGDAFTGEIKYLRYGELVFKSDYMKESVHLDWKRVRRLQSRDTFIVALSNGRRLTGGIEKKDANSKQPSDDFTIMVGDASFESPSADVITIDQQEGSVWNQLTGSISYGLSYAGGTTRTVNSSLGADVEFTTEKNSIRLATSSQFDLQTNAQNANRFTFDSQYGRVLTTKWIAAGLFSVLRSNQQDLDLRTTYGGGLGRRLVQTDRTSLLAISGLAYSHESYVPQPNTEPIRSNAEGLLGLTFNTFRFKTLNVSSHALLFPSLSEPGRVRVSSQSTLRIELMRNFTWNFQIYENYDTRPPVSAPGNDLGLTTSVGWTF